MKTVILGVMFGLVLLPVLKAQEGEAAAQAGTGAAAGTARTGVTAEGTAAGPAFPARQTRGPA
ncbi:MAG: hypothetical protein LBP23_00760 [Treponema sp.]|nr:hypothetical protein [Treponema sp.]